MMPAVQCLKSVPLPLSRPAQGCVVPAQDWVETMASYVKTLDSNHLLSVGAEGFYSRGSAANTANPQGMCVPIPCAS